MTETHQRVRIQGRRIERWLLGKEAQENFNWPGLIALLRASQLASNWLYFVSGSVDV